jgi:dTDP-4-dehydrorhamnose reductase
MKILILGGNGMIGHKVYQSLRIVYEDTWVLLRQNLKDLEYKDLFDFEKVIDGIDLKEFDRLSSILDNLNPDVIINAAGITLRRGVDLSISNTITINSTLPHFLEEWINEKSSKRLIHFSTDCVFSGKIGAYGENNIPDAVDYYGRTKALGEVTGSQSLTLRGSMIGRELANHTELLEWFLSQKGKTVNGFKNVIYSGITTVKMAEYVTRIVANFPSMSGLYNVSSIPISKYDLLKLFNENFDVQSKILLNEEYYSKKDLISNRFYTETGFNIPEWKDLVIELKENSIINSKYYKQY